MEIDRHVVFSIVFDIGNKNVKRHCSWCFRVSSTEPGWSSSSRTLEVLWCMWREKDRTHFALGARQEGGRGAPRAGMTAPINSLFFAPFFFDLFFLIIKCIINKSNMATGYLNFYIFMCLGCCILKFIFVLCYLYIIRYILKKHGWYMTLLKWL